MVHITLLLLGLLFSQICEATDLKPWFHNEEEVELQATILYQNYNSLSTPESHKHRARFPPRRHKIYHDFTHRHSINKNANDEFLTLSAQYPFQRYCCEFEVTGANTHHQNYRFDNFRITGRYQWLSESEGNRYSLVTGITLTEPFSRALHDISSFHHGHIEAEMTLSLGRKYGFNCDREYTFRWWNVIGLGTSDVGYPWVREDAACEYNYDDTHHFRGFINTLWGTGNCNIHPRHFSGYGFIKHRSVDLGFRYGYAMGCWGMLSIQYARRVYAYNFPENANLVKIEYYFDFGHQSLYNY